MARSESIFKRYEIKYLLSKEQYEALRTQVDEYIQPDMFFKSTIYSLYYDTPDNLLIRRSLDKPEYKEKLRLRSYGRATSDGKVYIELKKKYDGIVYKRREGMDYRTARLYLDRGFGLSKTSQIISELDYFKKFYENLEPSILIMCDREAYVSKEDESLRLTFDQNILFRDENLNLDTEAYGERVIEEGSVLMELKVAGAMPMWLVKMLNILKIYPTSFSKYGMAYKIKTKNGKNNSKTERKMA